MTATTANKSEWSSILDLCREHKPEITFTFFIKQSARFSSITKTKKRKKTHTKLPKKKSDEKMSTF